MRLKFRKPKEKDKNGICLGCPQWLCCWDALENDIPQQEKVLTFIWLFRYFPDRMNCLMQRMK